MSEIQAMSDDEDIVHSPLKTKIGRLPKGLRRSAEGFAWDVGPQGRDVPNFPFGVETNDEGFYRAR